MSWQTGGRADRGSYELISPEGTAFLSETVHAHHHRSAHLTTITASRIYRIDTFELRHRQHLLRRSTFRLAKT